MESRGPVSALTESGLRHVLEKLPAAAYTCDAEGLITYYNEHAVDVWGRRPRLNDPTDRYCGSFKLYSVEGQPIGHDQCWMALALKGQPESSAQEIQVEREDGERRLVLAHVSPLNDESGRVVGAVNILVDVTAQQKAEQSQALLAAIVESSCDAIVSKDLSGRILSWNREAERMFGYNADEAVGQYVVMLIPPERRSEEEVILERISRGIRIEHFETVRVRKDGRLIDVSLTISPVRDSRGRIIAASKIVRDITERKQADQALRELKDALATQLADVRRLHGLSLELGTTLELQPILEAALRTASAMQGTSMGLLSLYDAGQSRLTPKASVGLNAEFLESFRAAPEGLGASRACLRERKRVVVQDVDVDPLYEKHRDAARQVGFRSVHSTLLVTRGGAPLGVLSTFFPAPGAPSDREMEFVDLCARHAADAIENAQLHAEIKDGARRKDEFLAMLAHELRNPLAPITNSLEIMRLAGELSPTMEEVRTMMHRQVRHMTRIVDDLLEVSRLTRGKLELRREVVDLASILATAMDTCRPVIEARRHQFAVSIARHPIHIHADSVRITQVVANLLNNAAKYTPEGGQLWLTARAENGQAVISVRDTGVGIEPEMLSRVFELFVQVEKSLHRSEGGLGLGLTLARRLVEMHDGTLEARSDGPGRGSEFTVRLPLAETSMAEPARHSALAIAGTPDSSGD